MDESLQQFIALGLVTAVVAIELMRHRLKKQQGKAGCDGCDTGGGKSVNAEGETPIKFYKIK